MNELKWPKSYYENLIYVDYNFLLYLSVVLECTYVDWPTNINIKGPTLPAGIVNTAHCNTRHMQPFVYYTGHLRIINIL